MKTITLENGLRVFEIRTNLGSDVVSVDIFYDVGSKDEEYKKTGLAHMLEHLNFKSTKNHKAGEFDEIVKSFGGVNNASTSFDYTHYYTKCKSEFLDKSLELYADMMENLKFKNSEFLPEKDVVLEERFYRVENDPSGMLFFNMFNHAFINSPYHHTPIGFCEDIKNFNLKDIKEFHKKFYNPSNAIILITGDIKENEGINLVKKHFSNIKNKTILDNRIYRDDEAQIGEKVVFLNKKTQVEFLGMGFKIPEFNHIDQIALNGLEEYLSNGKNSIFYKELVQNKALANQIEVYNFSSKLPNLFFIFAICNDKVSALHLKNEIFKILNKDLEFNNLDLEKIKNNIKSDFIYSLDSASKIGSIYGSYLIKGDLEFLLNFEKNLANLSAKELKECSKKYLNQNNCTSIILKDLK